MSVGEVLPWTRYRKAARRTLDQAAQIPQFAVAVDLDASALLRYRDEVAKLSMTALLTKSLGVALPRHERLRAALRDEQIRVSAGVHVGVAIATPDGLVVPVVHDVDAANPQQIADSISALRDKALAGTLKAPDVTGAVMTLSNLGMYGVHNFTALLNPPQSSILATGAIRNEAGRRLIRATLTADHRVLDGADAARFLADLPEALASILPATLETVQEMASQDVVA